MSISFGLCRTVHPTDPRTPLRASFEKPRLAQSVTLLLLCVTLLLTGCLDAPPNPSAYLLTDFQAELRGTLGRSAFCAILTVENCEGGRVCTIRYTEPQILNGTELRLLFSDAGRAEGEVELFSSDGKSYHVDAAALEGLLAPPSLLLSQHETVSIQKTERGYLVTHADGGTLCLTEGGTPLAYTSDTLCFDVVSWQSVRP